MTSTTCNIVVEWLRSLQLGQYAESFLDNGYDDLEICKQVGDPDLDAIGVINPQHRNRLLESVRTLRETGAARVYFTLEQAASNLVESVEDCRAASRASSSSRSSDGKSRFKDEYEEGKAELLKIPKMQLKILLKEELAKDGVKLSSHPYSTEAGERGYLEGLASRYADRFSTHYVDVLEHLDELRRREWEETPVRVIAASSSAAETPVNSPATPAAPNGPSQPIYMPGKYSPSSCLTDKEEDEIYGFAGYGVYGKQMRQRQQQRLMLTNPSQSQTVLNYPCLSPRSAFFYEFPPTAEQLGSQTCKKKTSFAKFLRGLKTVHRKEKHGGSSPRHARSGPPNSRVGTPDNLLNGPMLPLPAMDPRMIQYDQLRVLQMNGSQYNFEETIHRLKLQDALKKKERFHRDHEEILRDIRQGLMQLGRENVRGADDTYMYDDDIRALGGHHWYDEPPYESDPDDFLMGITGQPSATIKNGRVCFTLNMRGDRTKEGILSLPSAGDISVGRRRQNDRTPRRGLILPQPEPYPPQIIPLTHARGCRESGDYAGSDVHSLSSRLSSFSVDTARSCQGEPSSDFDERESPVREGLRNHRRNHRHNETTTDGKLCLKLPSTSSTESLPSCSGSSTQALVRETSGHSSLSTTATEEYEVGADGARGSPIGPAPQTPLIAKGPVLARARALVDCVGSVYDPEALRFRKGDIIEVTQMNASGLWQGRVHNRVGYFKFINVEILTSKEDARVRMEQQQQQQQQQMKARERERDKDKENASSSSTLAKTRRNRPRTVEGLLQRIHMEEHTSVFVLNGYDSLELFRDLESHDLDFLGIRDPDHRAKILAAVQLLHDYDSDATVSSTSEDSLGSSSRSTTKHSSSLKNLRDSGCYEDEAQNRRKIKQTNNLDTKLFLRGLKKRNTSPETVELNVLKTPYNIPCKKNAKEFLEQTREVLDRAREVTNSSREVLERSELKEEGGKHTAKLVLTGFQDVHVDGGNAGFSEKSSDSGVSSSSLSSSKKLESPKDKRRILLNPGHCDSKKGFETNPFLGGESVRSPSRGLILQKK